MRRTFRKEVRERFRAAMAQPNLAFTPHPDAQHAWLKERDTLYRWSRSVPERTFFVLLLFHPTGGQEFTLEAAFSADGAFPADMMPLNPVARPDIGEWVQPEPPVDGAFRCRIGGFFGRQGDHWWSVSRHDEEVFGLIGTPDVRPETLLSKLLEEPKSEPGQIAACVDDAVQRVRHHVIPFFEKHLADVLRDPR